LIAFLSVFPSSLAIGLSDDGAVAALGLADSPGCQNEIDATERVLHTVGVMLDAARVKQETALRRSPELRRAPDRLFGNPGGFRRQCRSPLPAVVCNLVKPHSPFFDELVVDPVVLDHELQDPCEQGSVTSGFDGEEKIAGASCGSDAWVLNDYLCPLFAGLP